MTLIKAERAVAHRLSPIGFWLDTLAAGMAPYPFRTPGEYLSVGTGPGGGVGFSVRATEEVCDDLAAIERAVRAWYTRRHPQNIGVGGSCGIEIAGIFRTWLTFVIGQGPFRVGGCATTLSTSAGSILITLSIRVHDGVDTISCAEITGVPSLMTLVRTFTITSPAPGAGPALAPDYRPVPDRIVLTRDQLLSLSPDAQMDDVSSPPHSSARSIAVFTCVEQLRAAGVPFETLAPCRYAMWEAVAGLSSDDRVSPKQLDLLDRVLEGPAREYPVLGNWLAALRAGFVNVESIQQAADFLSEVISLSSFTLDTFEVTLSRGFPR